ncbi:MAG: hypothetical protein Q9160_005984 [Pyrenula sp. 1 TL-2023]
MKTKLPVRPKQNKPEPTSYGPPAPAFSRYAVPQTQGSSYNIGHPSPQARQFDSINKQQSLDPNALPFRPRRESKAIPIRPDRPFAKPAHKRVTATKPLPLETDAKTSQDSASPATTKSPLINNAAVTTTLSSPASSLGSAEGPPDLSDMPDLVDLDLDLTKNPSPNTKPPAQHVVPVEEVDEAKKADEGYVNIVPRRTIDGVLPNAASSPVFRPSTYSAPYFLEASDRARDLYFRSLLNPHYRKALEEEGNPISTETVGDNGVIMTHRQWVFGDKVKEVREEGYVVVESGEGVKGESEGEGEGEGESESDGEGEGESVDANDQGKCVVM